MKKLILSSALCLSFATVAIAPAFVFAQAPAAASAAAPAQPAAALAVAAAPAEKKELLPPPPANQIPFVQMVLNYVESIPAAGKVLSIVFQVLALLGVGLTALASILIVVQAAFAQAGKAMWAPLGVAAEWIAALMPWVKYLSMYNVHKDDKKV